jgi:hypothetical protein
MRKNLAITLLLVVFCFNACNKNDHPFFPENTAASRYSPAVIDKWIVMQLRLMRDATGIPNVVFSRYYAYSGVAAFQALAPAIPGAESIAGKWNGLTGLPEASRFKRYYWPASVNTALAFMNRNMFPGAGAADKTAIDSLETALNDSFSADQPASVLAQSNAFGLAVGTSVFNWSETDGYKHQSDPYISPTGPGLWVPTAPAFAPASTPYFGNNRPMVEHSGDHAQPGPPIAYSEVPGSPFFQMVKQVYDVSQHLTPEQQAMAIWWRDIPGESSPGHWLSILGQVITQTGARLDKAAWSYALTGVCLYDACVSCWQTKYTYTLVRPITYIRNVMGFTAWNSYLSTPAHPEYSSAHAVLSAATADAFTAIFGDIGSFTDHTYDYLGFAARTFPSFYAIGVDAGNSRLYAGIHYQPSIDTGLSQGRKVTANIIKRLQSENWHNDDK